MALQYFLGAEAETALYSLLVPSLANLCVCITSFLYLTRKFLFYYFFFSTGSAATKICSQKFAGATSSWFNPFELRSFLNFGVTNF